MDSILTPVDLLHPAGTENPGGIGTLHGYCALADITTLHKPVALDDGAATFTTVGSIATAHVFATSKCMNKFYSTENKGEVSVKSTGELDGRSARSEFKFYHPGSKKDVDGFVRYMRNTPCIFFAQEADGNIRQLGNDLFQAHVMVNYGTGATNDAYRGYEITVTSFGEAPIYPGLNFTPGT